MLTAIVTFVLKLKFSKFPTMKISIIILNIYSINREFKGKRKLLFFDDSNQQK